MFNVEIPTIFDAEDDEVDMTFDFAELSDFLKYDAALDKIVPNRQSNVDFNLVPDGTSTISITLTDDNPIGSLSSFYSILVTVKSNGDNNCPNPPCDVDPDCPNPPCPPNPTPTQPADPGMISDITNTGDIVVNLKNNFMDDLLKLYENPQRRRALFST